jgi:hypothetical protein
MSQYDKLDFLLVERIKTPGKHTFAGLMSGSIEIETKRLVFDDIAARGAGKARPAFRVVDARLQALRKRGLIEFVGGQWRAKGVK